MKLFFLIFLLHLSVFNIFAQPSSKISIGKIVLDSHLDSVQKLFDYQLVKERKVDLDTICNNLDYFRSRISSYKIDKRKNYSRKISLIDVFEYYYDELSGSGGLIEEVSNYSIKEVKINDFCLMENVELKFYQSFLFQISCQIQLNSPTNDDGTLLSILIQKFGNKYKKISSDETLWENSEYIISFKDSLLNRYSLSIIHKPVFNLLKNDEKIIISNKIIKVNDSYKEGVKEGF